MLLVYFLMITLVLCCFFAATREHCCFWVKHQYCHESKEVFHQRGPHKGSMNGPGSQSNTTKFRSCSDKNLVDICGRPTKLWLYISRPSAGKFPDPYILLPMTWSVELTCIICGLVLPVPRWGLPGSVLFFPLEKECHTDTSCIFLIIKTSVDNSANLHW